MAVLSATRYEGTARQANESYNEHGKRVSALLDALSKKTFEMDENQVEGALIRFQVADGFAYYVVEKAVPLTLQYFPFLDEYRIPAAHLRGLEFEDVLHMIRQDRAWQKLMSRPRATS